MRTFIIVLAALLAVFLFGGTCPASRYTPGRASAVEIAQGGGGCSATVVGENLLLTAAHCFGDDLGSPIVVDGRRVANWRIMADDGADHVLVWVGVKLNRPAAKLCKVRPELGDELHVWGNPMQMHELLRVGRYLGRGTLDGVTFDLFDMNTWHGDSGAALFTGRGCIAGVVMGAYGDRARSFAWRIGLARPLAFDPKIMAALRER